MDKQKSKQRAVGLLVLFCSVLVLIATWDLPSADQTKGTTNRGGYVYPDAQTVPNQFE
jgi:hypothetical protein